MFSRGNLNEKARRKQADNFPLPHSFVFNCTSPPYDCSILLLFLWLVRTLQLEKGKNPKSSLFYTTYQIIPGLYLCCWREVSVNIIDLFFEPFVQHFIGLVEHQHLDGSGSQGPKIIIWFKWMYFFKDY